MGWREWRGFDRLDALDRRFGLRREQLPPQETAARMRRWRRIVVPLTSLVMIDTLIQRRWFAVVLGAIAIPLWIRLPNSYLRKVGKRCVP